MPDNTYQPKVYRKQGGDEQVVASGGQQTFESGGKLKVGSVEYQAGTHRLEKTVAVAVAGKNDTGGGALAAVANPESAKVLITRVLLDRTTKSTGAAAGNIGVAANGTTSSDNLIDGVALGASEGLEDNIEDAGTNGKARQIWDASEYVTMSGEADSTGLAAVLYITYIPVTA